MKTKNTVTRALVWATQSNWIQPALLTLAIVLVLGATGCDSGHGGNHGR